MNAEDRFWAKVDRNGPVPDYAPHLGPCWIWLGYTHLGYGIAYFDRKYRRAHRVAYELLKEPIPKGLVIDHLCRVTSCVNPAHLEAVTDRVNTLRGFGPTSVNATKTHCIRGHEFTEENTYMGRTGRECRVCRSLWHERRKKLDPRYVNSREGAEE